MLFSDFYKESDRNARRSLKIFGLVFLAIFAYIAVVIAVFSNQPTQKDIEQFISKSSTLRELDRYCQEIPKPQNFQLKFRSLGGNSEGASIGYWYQSDSPFPKVRDFYIHYFENEGWTLENLWNDAESALPRLLKYRKGNRTVSLERVPHAEADYVFNCSIEK